MQFNNFFYSTIMVNKWVCIFTKITHFCLTDIYKMITSISRSFNWRFANQLKWDKTFNDIHYVSLLGQMSFQKQKYLIEFVR